MPKTESPPAAKVAAKPKRVTMKAKAGAAEAAPNAEALPRPRAETVPVPKQPAPINLNPSKGNS